MFLSRRTPAQSLTSGDITGTVTDPTGSVLPGASVTLTNTATGATQTATANNDGSYRFAFLAPGRYGVSVNLAGFQKTTQYVDVAIGQTATSNFQLAVASSTT